MSAKSKAGNLPQLEIGERTFTILFPELLRPLDKAEREKLKRSIKKHGVVVPVVVDEGDGIIDGGNRVTLAAELRLADIPTDIRGGLTLEQKASLATSLNEHRRHLDGGELRSLAASKERLEAEACAMVRQGGSLREVAEQTGLSKSQVHRLVTDPDVATVPVGTVATPQTTGANGKTYLPPEALEERRGQVAELREQGMSQREIAKEVGIDVSQVNRDLKAVEARAKPAPVRIAEERPDDDATGDDREGHASASRFSCDGRLLGSTRVSPKQRLFAEAEEATEERLSLQARAAGGDLGADRASPPVPDVEQEEAAYDEVWTLTHEVQEELWHAACNHPVDNFGGDSDWTPRQVLEEMTTNRDRYRSFVERLDAAMDLHRKTWGL